ncbi:MAG: hypothetical protein WEB06_00780 [Actinomycetota bacterium]
MAAKKKVTPKRTTSRTKKTTKSKAKSKKTGRKTGAKLYSDRNLKTAITPIDSRDILRKVNEADGSL